MPRLASQPTKLTIGVMSATVALLCGVGGSAQAGTYQGIYGFPTAQSGLQPYGSLVVLGNKLFGTTFEGGSTFVSGHGAAGQGTVFSLGQQAGETVVHSFQGAFSDGGSPAAGLTAIGGMLYGTTQAGGSGGRGTVFSLAPSTGVVTILHSFFGTTDGSYPVAGLINVNGTLYGTTSEGGPSDCDGGCGTVFSIDPTTGAEKIVHGFHGPPDGFNPQAGLLNVGGMLYGTTMFGGGPTPSGTVFALNPVTRVETVLYNFTSGADGGDPLSDLIDVGGVLYGTAYRGGSFTAGTVFSLNLATHLETTVHAFKGGNDGAGPKAGLIDVAGVLYGTTYGIGGAGADGTLFSINLATGVETVEHGFRGGKSDGAQPKADLINVGGTLYGTTVFGGSINCGNSSAGCGTVFGFTP